LATRGDREISPATAAVRAFVIEAREDLEIAREVNELLSPR
jgi:acetate kinase